MHRQPPLLFMFSMELSSSLADVGEPSSDDAKSAGSRSLFALRSRIEPTTPFSPDKIIPVIPRLGGGHRMRRKHDDHDATVGIRLDNFPTGKLAGLVSACHPDNLVPRIESLVLGANGNRPWA
ncbi:hypothetical protein P152DRAFT_4027 [Eremomyces bilateralis CBS 781.70]|uniref:Secreted protein n=1 Tax=Eremomyces bilateralis CBS 781.70 TaxID=1392243 RepID=A0A6G1GFU1_9PEZI|nr:uncharacterized protein P152DRAFT_4027 [Eremomyces bilateralis CBS 781.70]KAF1816923.1 hypothetical protein P152DRAFT_4027 [Eremomyces bilateralis CBS 781.70]